MSLRTRHFLAVLGGIVVVALSLGWIAFVAQLPLALPDHLGSSHDTIKREFGDAYAGTAYLTVAVAAGASFTLLTWERRVSPWRGSALYWVLLAAVLPISFINYFQADIRVSRAIQALLDAVLVVLGAVCVGLLQRWRTTVLAERVLKALVSALLVTESVLTPLIFAVLWTLNAQGLIARNQTTGIVPGWISAVAAAGGLVFSVQRYLAEQASPDQPAREPGRLI